MTSIEQKIKFLLTEGFTDNQIVEILNEKKSTKKTPAQKKKFEKVMKEFKDKTLKSNGKVVTDYKQAVAIAYSESKDA